MIYFSTLLLSFFITITLIPVCMRAAMRLQVMDVPDARKVHASPIPKCGGVAMAFGTLLPVLFMSREYPQQAAILVGSGIIVLFGVWDDLKDANYKIKFGGQIAAALIVILWGGVSIRSLGMLLPAGVVLPDYVAIPLTLVTIVGVTNAVNLSDGLDGLAGGISILGFCLIGYLALMSGNYFITLISFGMVGAISGFLRFNSYPARLFMGDAGSQLLGFLAVTLSLAVTQNNGPYNVLVPLMIVGFPVLDTLRVMTTRMINGVPLFSADKNHLHHRLMGLGFFQTETVFLIYVYQTLLIVAAYVFRFYSEWVLLVLYLFLSAAILSCIVVAEKKGWELKRQGFIDLIAIKNKLRIIFREEYITVKVCFRLLQLAVPLIFLVSCLLPGEIPSYLSFIALAFSATLVVLLLLKHKWREAGIRLSLYLTIPVILYYGEINRSALFNDFFMSVYDICFLALVVPAGLTMRFTRRQKGFRTTPMDFLIFFVALAVVVMPGFSAVPSHMRLLATKVIVLFFTYEVLIGEMRGKVRWLGWMTAGALIILGLGPMLNF
jgi:UDP-GlcNAc:undecaprenyl-phosphate/decaprenyl-phosphate GlcNAc-1-phosphate transferase